MRFLTDNQATQNGQSCLHNEVGYVTAVTRRETNCSPRSQMVQAPAATGPHLWPGRQLQAKPAPAQCTTIWRIRHRLPDVATSCTPLFIYRSCRPQTCAAHELAPLSFRHFRQLEPLDLTSLSLWINQKRIILLLRFVRGSEHHSGLRCAARVGCALHFRAAAPCLSVGSLYLKVRASNCH